MWCIHRGQLDTYSQIDHQVTLLVELWNIYFGILKWLIVADRVFGPHTTSDEVYEVAAKPVVKAAMEGVNGMKSLSLHSTLNHNVICGQSQIWYFVAEKLYCTGLVNAY